MLKHIVMWNIKKEVKDVKKVKREAKEAIEGLYGKVPAIQKITFVTETLPSSNMDVAVIAEVKDEEALKAYATHPLHVEAGEKFIRPFMENRSCIDFFY
mgnify:FL=1